MQMFRWLALATIAACLSISIHYRRRAREQSGVVPRSKEHPLLIAGRTIVAIPLWGAVAAYVLNPAWMQWSSVPSPIWTRWVGVCLGLLTVPAIFWVFSSLGSNVSETILTKERHELVTRGPYAYVRHPLYSTGVTLILALGLMAANWFILSLGLLAFVSIRLAVVPLEERQLIEKFGDRYRAYMDRTGSMFPRLVTPRRP